MQYLVSFCWQKQTCYFSFYSGFLAQMASEKHSVRLKSLTFILACRDGGVWSVSSQWPHSTAASSTHSRLGGIPSLPTVAQCSLWFSSKWASVSNKDHCSSQIDMLVWTTDICYNGSLSLSCLPFRPPRLSAALSIRQVIIRFSTLPWALVKRSQNPDLSYSINKLSRCVMHSVYLSHQLQRVKRLEKVSWPQCDCKD